LIASARSWSSLRRFCLCHVPRLTTKLTTKLLLAPQRRIHLSPTAPYSSCASPLLHGWQDMRIDIHRHANLRVPQHFLHDFWVDSQR